MRPQITIQNVVATADAGRGLDLKRIGGTLEAAQYDPDNFPGLCIRTEDPRGSVLLFSTGKAVCTGAKSAEKAAEVVGAVFGLLRRRGLDGGDAPPVRVRNVVATADMGRRIRLASAAVSLPSSMYEPEMFPGLVHRIADPRAVLLLFSTGRVVCAGAESGEDAERAVAMTHTQLEDLGLFVDSGGA